MLNLQNDDPAMAALIDKERLRLEETLDLIAAENHAPASIMETLGSVFNTKTIEGYPGRRYHAGCTYADEVERLAISRCQSLFGAEHVNVQPHSGTSANLAIYFSVLNVGDRILSMTLSHGGHLSHGHSASITGKCFDVRHYGVEKESGVIDYQTVAGMADAFRPAMIIAGASSYPRLIDYRKMSEIAGSVSAYLLVDMAHIGGLVAAGVIPSPVPHADFVTFTCYKTMMGGRGGVILSRRRFAEKIDKSVFPGCQGTSAVNTIAAKAVIFKLAGTPGFIRTQAMTLKNAAHLAVALQKRDFRIVTRGTDTHQVLVDVTPRGLDGRTAEQALESAGIVLNQNVIPGDENRKGAVSGIRLGTAGVSARGMGTKEVEMIAEWMARVMVDHRDSRVLEEIRREVASLCSQFSVYGKNGRL
ncbi:MAG: serine hydroxymethyltransferase [Deltaproteobacteria bacterium]|nr:serine hydroxymethyltransferase [Deltaproteobacteria bacterium]